MVRKIKDSKKDQIRIKDTYELKREKEWDERFIYSNYETNKERRPLPKKVKNDYSANIKYLKEQFYPENYKKANNTVNKTRGKSGFKIYKEKNNTNKIKLNGNYLPKNNNNKNDDLQNLNNTDENINKNSIKISINDNINIINNENNNKYYSMPKEELEICVEILWNKLGVKETYCNKFNNLKNEKGNEETQKELLILEIENLEKLEHFLKNMSKNIENREKSILLLKKIVETIEKQFINLNLDIRENILNDFLVALKNYRIVTLKVVENIDSFRQIFSYPINKGKFVEKILMKKYGLLDNECINNYNGNYLLKLKDDIDFLGKSKINGYKDIKMNFSIKEDPFLLNISEIVPISKEYYSNIKQCQYIIMQEMIFDKIIKDSITIEKNEKKNIKEINNNVKSYQKKEKEKISCINKSNEKLNDSNKIKKKEKIVIETQLIDKNNYEKFFGNNDLIEETSEEQTLLDLKKGYDIIHNFNKKKHKIEAKENKIDNINNNKIEEEFDNKKEKEENEIKKREEINVEESINIDKKINNDKDDKLEREKKEEELNKNFKMEENIKNENNNNKTIEKINDDKENNISKKSEKNEELLKIEIKNNNKTIPEEEYKEEMNTSKKSDEYKQRTEKKEMELKLDLHDKDNNDDIVNIQERKNEIDKNKDNNIENNSLGQSQIRKKLSRSLTPKSQRESKINQLTSNEINKDNNQSNTDIFNLEKNVNNDIISFYCDKLSNFISMYKIYYQSIPQEQKIIFNIKENPIEYIHNNFYPKIIIFSDKNKKIIKGLCIISHIFWKKNELYIEHISSYKNGERENIFEMFLSFIKENSYKILGYDNNIKENDIYIDLYYKNEEGKFIINEQIKDYFKKRLNFKWVKLVNISKYERYIEMRHHFNINQTNNKNRLNNEYDDNNILNQSILGKKEFNNEEVNNNLEEEEKSEDSNNMNIDISTVFEISKENNENNNKANINKLIYKNKEPNLLNNFCVKNKTVLKFNNRIYENKNNSNENIPYSNPLNLVYLLNKIYNSQNTTLYEMISPNINSYFNSKDSIIIEQSLQRCNRIKNNLIVENSNYYSDITELSKEIKNKFKINVNINALLPFENCVSFIHNQYYYNRIKIPKLQIFKERFTQQIFYMITKNETHAVLISADLNNIFIDKFLNRENKNNISINFMNIYNNLSNVDDVDNNILYIPAFEIKNKFVNNCFNKIQSDKKYNLYCYEDFYNIKFLSEELTINKNMKKNDIKKSDYLKMNFDYDLINDNDTNQSNFIKDNFLLIVFDWNLMEQLREFPLLTLYVTKDNFIHK